MAASVGLIGGIGSVSAKGPENASLNAQINAVRGVTSKYVGTDGVARAYADGFVPTAPVAGNGWFLGRVPIDGTVELLEPTGLIYLGGGADLRLGAVGYAASYPDGPPDLFNDEGEDLRISEADGWMDSGETLYTVFSNRDGDGDDSITDLPMSVVFDRDNWAWLDFDPGATHDIDGDGVDERIDFTYHKKPFWALHVWMHEENPGGLFSAWYESGEKTRR